jgi:hypothetical protein
LLVAIEGPALPPPQPEARPFYKRWWPWTIAGAVVAGVVVGTVIGTRGSSTSAPLTGPKQQATIRFVFP